MRLHQIWSSARRLPPAARTWIILACILSLGAALRWHRIADDALWLDEVYCIELAMGRGYVHRALPANTLIDNAVDYTDPDHRGPWSGIWKTTTLPLLGDIHPPLGYITLRLWGNLFGFGDGSVRSLSAVASLLSVLLLFLAARELHGDGVALWAALLMAIASAQIAFAQEAKHYALTQALALSAALALVRIERRGVTWPRFAWLSLSVLATIMTHYFAIGAVLALGLYASLRLRGRRRIITLGAFMLAGLCFAVIWLPRLVAQRHSQSAEIGYFSDTGPDAGLHLWENLAAAPFKLIGFPPPSAARWSYGMSIIYILPVILIIFGRRRDLLPWTLWLLCVVGVVVAADIANHTRTLEMRRYTLLASAGMFALCAAMAWPLRPLLRHGVPLAVALAALPFIPSGWGGHFQQNRELAAAAIKFGHPGGVTVFSANTPLFAYANYLIVLHYAHQLPGPAVILTRPPDAALLQQLRQRGSVVYVDDSFLPADHAFPGAKTIDGEIIEQTGVVHQILLPEPGQFTNH